jgi:AraC-like DNA-binding protein
MDPTPHVQVSIVEGARTLCRTSWHYRDINSPFARIYHVISGRGMVEHHGQTVVLEPGPLYLIPPHTLSHYRCPFRMDLNWLHVTAMVNRSLDLFSVLHPGYVCAPGKTDDFGTLFRPLLAAARRPGIGNQLQAEGLATYLLSRFFEHIPAQEQDARFARLRRFDPVVAYMREQLAQPLTLAQLAARIHLHPTYFSNLFTQVMGLPPMPYLIRLRVAKAQELLWFTELPVKQIASRVGFDDEFYFSRQFKKIVGRAPLPYRRHRTLHAGGAEDARGGDATLKLATGKTKATETCLKLSKV